jgi:tubulin---tyrosine ligase
MMTSINGNLKGYTYEDGYLRTSCVNYNTNNLADRTVHLTNDSIQKHADDYGKFEPGNKMNYLEFQRYIDKRYGERNVNFERDILP